MKEFGPRGGRPWRPPLDPPMPLLNCIVTEHWRDGGGGGARDAHPSRYKFLSFSCSFRKISCQIIGFKRLRRGWHPLPSGKSWIRHCWDSNSFSYGSRISQMGGASLKPNVRVPTYCFGHFSQKLHEIEESGPKEGIILPFSCVNKNNYFCRMLIRSEKVQIQQKQTFSGATIYHWKSECQHPLLERYFPVHEKSGGGGVCSRGVGVSDSGGGVCSGGGWYPRMHWGRPPPPGETATAADGTHPTGMHSCM